VKTGEVYGRLAVQYGDNCVTQRKIYVKVDDSCWLWQFWTAILG